MRARQAARSLDSLSPWVGPKLIVSGAAAVTVACPLASDGVSRVPCLPPSALVFVGGVQATVLDVSREFDVARVQLPEQQSVCGGPLGSNSTTGGPAERNGAGTVCGVQAVLIVPPPLRTP